MNPGTLSVLAPAMPSRAAPSWESATWVGLVDLPVEPAERIELESASGYRHARLLVRSAGRPVAMVNLDVADGAISGPELTAAVGQWNATGEDADIGDGGRPAITVVICTRNRVESLEVAVRSVLDCDYPHLDVVIVDNASDDDATAHYIARLADPRVTLVREPLPGLAGARNTGIGAAVGDIIAFTDDDVVVDPQWLSWISAAFGTDERVGCVTGIVPSGELRTPTQSFFEQRVSWAKSLQRRAFDVNRPPAGSPLFPFQVGLYGTGANFALRRRVVLEIGGFDEALGAGSPTGGGEDIDMFVRVLVSGRQLVYEPAAIVWHRHRDDTAALQSQARGYGQGLGAWLTKVALDRTLRPMALRRAVQALRHLRTITESPEVDDFVPPESLRRTQLIGLARGPVALATARRQGRRPTPLAS
ncbi:glycosyltransferase family 2 protein [Mycolicibacterium bacteremicum]|uniref:glycosyltransferase family 2 protein n=1 Tax=Mycolicibacterium bacteremicum TaxID=564198 RepID=UPI0026EB096A|nr:glycosyltransferase family A protein [Mycolicibacterium bacteremicum]